MFSVRDETEQCCKNWHMVGENLKSCLENKRSRQTRVVASLEVGVKSSERERVSLINCTRNVVDLSSKVSRISRGVG